MKKLKKLLSLFLAVLMCVSLLNLTVFAADGDGSDGTAPVAKIGEQDYNTLQEAIDAAKANDTVTLMADVTLNSAMDEATGGSSAILIQKNLTLNGNSKTITVSGNFHGIQVYGDVNVVISDLTITGAGKDALLVNGGSNVTVNGLTTSGSGWGAINVDHGSTLDAIGLNCAETVKVWSEDAGKEDGSAVNVAGFVTVNGIDGERVHYTTEDGVAALVASKGYVAQVDDKYYTDLAEAIEVATVDQTVTVFGTVTADVTIDKNLTLKGGTINGTVTVAENVTLTIDGVTIVATNGPGIAVNGMNVTLEVKGENSVTSTAMNYAGIEVPMETSLTITGEGNLTAKGNGGAGVGGSCVGNVEISKWLNGEITVDMTGKLEAVGTASPSNGYYGGAGIGAASYHNPDNIKDEASGAITVKNGTIVATALNESAGIGGGSHTPTGVITITGGNVTAVGHNSAGIGCGDKGTGTATVTIPAARSMPLAAGLPPVSAEAIRVVPQMSPSLAAISPRRAGTEMLGAARMTPIRVRPVLEAAIRQMERSSSAVVK